MLTVSLVERNVESMNIMVTFSCLKSAHYDWVSEWVISKQLSNESENKCDTGGEEHS